MKMIIVAVRDIKANVYAQPMFVNNIGGAIRGFGDECMREDHQNLLWKHPEDFELHDLGLYNDADGTFETHKPLQIAVGSNYKR